MARAQLLAAFVAGSLVGGLTVRPLDSDASPAAATADAEDGGAFAPVAVRVTAYTVRPGSVSPLFPREDGGWWPALEACAHAADDAGALGPSLGCQTGFLADPADLAAAELLNRAAAELFAADGGKQATADAALDGAAQ